MDEKSEKLKNIIKSQYRSIRAFSEATGIPNTTIATALKKGIGGTAVETVIAICEKLNIDVKTFEPLPDSKIKSDLTYAEIEHIKKYRALDERGKENVDETLEREYQYAVKKSKDTSEKAV